jgi:hypothetical protein
MVSPTPVTLAPVRRFLIVFDRPSGHLVDEVKEFDQDSEALAAPFVRERQERGNPDIEVVVLRAENREALEKTHSRYFGKTGDLVG